MQSKFPLHLRVMTVWLRFSLLGSDISFNQLALRSGADQKPEGGGVTVETGLQS